MNIPKDLYYTNNHVWVRKEGGEARLGLTEFLKSDMGDVLLVELPAIGKRIGIGENVALIETAKAVVDLKSPLSGTVVRLNFDLEENPDVIQNDPYGDGWIVIVELDTEEGFDNLMSPKMYEEYLKGKGAK